MKFYIRPFILILLIILLIPVYAQQVDGKSIETILKNADAIQAMAVANQLKWSRKEIKSYLTPRE